MAHGTRVGAGHGESNEAWVDNNRQPIMATKHSRLRASSEGKAIASTADLIAAELRQRVIGGTYTFGEKLPPERQLADSFAASRGTVREALRSLEENRLVARRIGSGTFVIYEPAADEEDVADITSPLELVDVRAAVEPQIARLAVRNMTARDIAQLEEALHYMEAAPGDAERFTHWDEEFHFRLAQATHNPLMVFIYQQVNHVRGHDQWRSIKDKILTPDRIAAYNEEHRALFGAMVRRDAARAVQIIVAHMERAHNDLLASAG